MALIDCPECGKQISNKAPTCPGCGVPMALGVAVERKSSGERVPYSDQEVARLISTKSKTSHLLHFFLSLFTLGLWLPVWFIIGITNGIANDLIDTKIAKGQKVY